MNRRHALSMALGVMGRRGRAGAPGMEAGAVRSAYQVLLVDRHGRAQVFSAYT